MRKFIITALVLIALVATASAFAQTPTNTATATPTATSTPTNTPTITPLSSSASADGPLIRFCNGFYNGACATILKGGATQDGAQGYLFQSKGTWNAYVDLWFSCDQGATKTNFGTLVPTSQSTSQGQVIRQPVTGACWIGGTKRNWVSGDVNVVVSLTGATAMSYYPYPSPSPTPTRTSTPTATPTP